MSLKRADIEEAIKWANWIVRKLNSWPTKMFVGRKYRYWAKAIRDILRDVCPLVPE